MNNVSLSGRLTEDPKLVHRTDHPVCEMRLAVDNGPHKTTFVDVRTYDEQAYVCAEYLRKGRKIGVIGRLSYREWRAADDSKRERYSVIGDVEFLDSPPSDPDPEFEGAEESDRQPQLVAA